MPEEWRRHLAQWNRWNQPKKQRVNGFPVPEPNMEILLYQTLIGAWPLSDKEIPEFKERLKAYAVKAAREAKVFTSWLSTNPEYESALLAFLESILDNSDKNKFLADLLLFEKQVAYYGALNSFAQVLLKITLPGVPDFYQGTELWDYSFVDPDNRRPVYFKKRIQLLEDIIKQEAQEQKTLTQQLLNTWEDGRLKLYITYKALNVRKSYKDVFLNGQYIPLRVTAQKQEHICAFGRYKDSAWFLIVVPRLLTKLVHAGTLPIGQRVWGDDLLLLPEGTPGHWLNVFTGEKIKTSCCAGQGLALSDIMRIFPVAILIGI
jgi:(1->4)-alpha-D-glucan 1-alpha-D-glucosylmutase